MTANKASYAHPHPKFTVVTPTGKDALAKRKWLEGRLKHPTGFCSPYNPVEAQGHEGTRPKSAAGAPLRVCDFFDTCPCSCHYEVDQMYAMLDMPREEPEQSPEYLALSARRSTEFRLMLDALYGIPAIDGPLSIPDGVDTPDGDERPVAANVEPLAGVSPQGLKPVFAATPTGKRPKGELEYDVLTICNEFVNGVYDWPMCTPKLVSEAIGKMHAVEPPSTGAVNAVWDRWEKLGFAEQAKKPNHFLKFSSDSSVVALDAAKKRAKRDKKQAATAAKRVTIRPKR